MTSRNNPSRATRGKRTAELTGSDAENDEEFWNHDTWEESSEDEEYSTEEGGVTLPINFKNQLFLFSPQFYLNELIKWLRYCFFHVNLFSHQNDHSCIFLTRNM
jgi:hypothetical protein